MKKFYSQYLSRNFWFHALTVVSILMLVASWICPPTGEISPSVLAAIGEIFAFAALGTVIKAIDNGTKATLEKGDVRIIVGDEKEVE